MESTGPGHLLFAGALEARAGYSSPGLQSLQSFLLYPPPSREPEELMRAFLLPLQGLSLSLFTWPTRLCPPSSGRADLGHQLGGGGEGWSRSHPPRLRRAAVTPGRPSFPLDDVQDTQVFDFLAPPPVAPRLQGTESWL